MYAACFPGGRSARGAGSGPALSAGTPAALKLELRRALRERRGRTPAAERERASRAVAERLVERVDWEAVSALHIYLAVAAWGELETEPIRAYVARAWPRIAVVSPTTARDQPLPEQAFELIVVPVLGFDASNHRLGLGAGFYDRFLATQPQALKLGLAYDWARIAGGLPHEPHDVPLDEIVTDAGIQVARRVR